MSEKIEGTLTLDGLIEGRVPDEESAARVKEWGQFAAKLGLRFNVAINGNAFSILPETAPASVEPLGGKPEKVIADLLGQLIEALPPQARPRLFSTLRSAEYRPGQEVQAIYAVSPAGTVEVQTRNVDATTTPPPVPVTLKEKVRFGVGGLLLALAIVGVTSLFVDLRGLFSEVINTVRPTQMEEVTVDTGPFAGLLNISKKDISGSPATLLLVIQRGPGYPASDEALAAAIKDAGDSVRKRLALETLATGYIHCELYDAKSKFLGVSIARLTPLRDGPTMELGVQFPQGQRVAKIAFGL